MKIKVCKSCKLEKTIEMDNIYFTLAKLARSTRYQNLFYANKEMKGIKLFDNQTDFSNLQQLFINNLFTFDSLNRDIVQEKISKRVLDDSIFWNSYLLWRQKIKPTLDEKKRNTKKKDVSLVATKEIHYPKPEAK